MVRTIASHLSLSGPALKFALIAALVTLTLPLPAHAKNWSGGLRIGTAQEGAQGTIESGLEFGAVLDRMTGGAFDFGIGIGVAMDEATVSRYDVTILNLEVHARTSTARRPVYAEVGLGWYGLYYGPMPSMELDGNAGLGGFLGVGYEWRSTEWMRIGLGATYHMIGTSSPNPIGGGGSMEDYFAIGATVRW